MGAPTLWDAPPPYQAHSETSIMAAESVRGQAGNLRELVLAALRLMPMTDEELAEFCHLNPNTCRPRRIELVQRGLVMAAGTTVGRSGRKATVWSVA